MVAMEPGAVTFTPSPIEHTHLHGGKKKRKKEKKCIFSFLPTVYILKRKKPKTKNQNTTCADKTPSYVLSFCMDCI